MGVSHQDGWVVLRGKRWYGYFRRRVLDPTTNEEREDTVCILLELKSKMTKSEARDALRTEIVTRTGRNLADRVVKDSSVTFEWFVRNRYFPLRKGDWRPETAKAKMAQIEIDLIGRFGEYPLDSFDRFMLQTHVNDLALRYSQDRVKQAGSYLKSIFDEAIEQEFLVKDPARKLKTPKNLRPKNKRVLSWDEMWSILAETAKPTTLTSPGSINSWILLLDNRIRKRIALPGGSADIKLTRLSIQPETDSADQTARTPLGRDRPPRSSLSNR
jgi:integrase